MVWKLKENTFMNTTKWLQEGPDNIVAEDCLGWDVAGYLYFPNVQSCTVVAVSTSDDRVLGFHFTVATSENGMTQLADKLLTECHHADITRVWVVGGCYSTGSGWSSFHPLGEGMRTGIRKLLKLHWKHQIHSYQQPAETIHYYRLSSLGGTSWGDYAHDRKSPEPGDVTALVYTALGDDVFEHVRR